MKAKPVLVAIYAAYIGDVCEYVGAASKPQTRFLQHYHSKAGKFNDCAEGTVRFVIIRWVPRCDAGRIERWLIAYFRAKGQAKRNCKNVGYFARTHTSFYNRRIKCTTTGEIFPSLSETARAFRCSPAAISNWIRERGNGPGDNDRLQFVDIDEFFRDYHTRK